MSDSNGFFSRRYAHADKLRLEPIHSCPQLLECIRQVGFLPLLESGIPGFCAEGLMAEECRYTEFPDGSWDWPLWQWKGSVVRDGEAVYGRFFAGKAGFISREWWPDFFNWRRSRHTAPEPGSVEDAILNTLREHRSMVARELRAACGMTGKNMRSRFDALVNRLQMATYIVTEDFVYPRDKHGNQYGFGWSLLSTPEHLFGHDNRTAPHSPQESCDRMTAHLRLLLPDAADAQIAKIIR